jgi:hypothetical protein
MKKRAENEGFRILDDFVCDAIPDPSLTPAKPAHQGQNEGMSVVTEIVFDLSKEVTSEDSESDKPHN